MKLQRRYCIVSAILLFSISADAFLLLLTTSRAATTTRDAGCQRRPLLIRTAQRSSSSSNSNEEEDFFIYDQRSRLFASSWNKTDQANYLDDLTPPPINIARNSILFSENPATKRNNAFSQLWKMCLRNLPPIFTGAWPWRDASITERNPVGALYNMMLVRIPTVGIGAVYAKNLWEGHPLIMDFGQGAFEMSPVVVLSVLALILA